MNSKTQRRYNTDRCCVQLTPGAILCSLLCLLLSLQIVSSLATMPQTSRKRAHNIGVPVEEDKPKREKVDEHESIAFVNNLSDLKQITSDAVQLAVWRQEHIPSFINTLSNPSLKEADLPRFQGLIDSSSAKGEIASLLKSHIYTPYKLRSQTTTSLTEQDIDELVTHIEQLVRVFADIAKPHQHCEHCHDIHVKLEVTNDDGCKFWHQDSVPYRLIATYRGPCTEYVPPTLSESTLKRRQYNNKHSLFLEQRDVALFKGRGHDDPNQLVGQPGIVHRSPRNKGHRVVLVLDIPQEGWHF